MLMSKLVVNIVLVNKYKEAKASGAKLTHTHFPKALRKRDGHLPPLRGKCPKGVGG